MKLPNYIDLAIIGAGVQALTLTTHLLQKSAKHYRKFLVFDPSQTWMSQWQQQFEAQQIPCLRSPAVHHPDPNLPKSNFFIMGGLAALRIGPVARNIGGGKMAAKLIVSAIVKPSLAIE